MLSLTTYAQKWQFKAGIVSPLPVDVMLQTTIQLKSCMGEASYKLSPKFKATFNAGYLVQNYRYDEAFATIVSLPGLRYTINETLYVGGSYGYAHFSEKLNDYEMLWSPYIGIQGKKLSCDMRYFNYRQINNSLNTIGLVISYIL